MRRLLPSPGTVFFVGFAALGIACSRTEPSRTPLSPHLARAEERARPSSSRAVDPSEETEDRDELEIVVTPSDDDDSASTTKLSNRNGAKAPSAATSLHQSPLAAGSACTLASGAAPDCGQLPSGGACLGASLARRACETLGPAVDTRVGASWLSCMRAPAPGAVCDSHRIVECGLRAVGDACVDGAYHAFCSEIATACADVAEQITAPVCEQLIAAWKPERRGQMLECLRRGCETGGFGACLP